MSTSAPESEPHSQRLLVTLCTYNERENIEVLLPEIRKYLPNAHILVVDDDRDIREDLRAYLTERIAGGQRPSMAARDAAGALGVQRRRAYELALALVDS